MGLIAKEPEKGNFEPLAEGVYMAKCYLLADIGEQWNKLAEKWKEQVIIGWEIEDETVVIDGAEQPRTIHAFYANSLHRNANLRGVLESWRGKKFTEEELKGFDLRNIVGTGCQVQVTHWEKADGTTVPQVKGVMALPKGVQSNPPSQTIIFDIEEDMAKLNEMPNIVKNAVAKSKLLAAPEEKPFGGDDDELPF